jgi:hypothetical protein
VLTFSKKNIFFLTGGNGSGSSGSSKEKKENFNRE